MVAGEFYEPSDPELVAAYRNARAFAGHSMRRAPMISRNARDDARALCRGWTSVRIEPPFFCDYGFNIRLGQSVFFNYNCIVLDVCEVTIGRYTMFGPAVQIYTALHPFNADLRRKVEYGKPVQIDSDVWVGGGAIICPGVHIGSPRLSAPAALSPATCPRMCSPPVILAAHPGNQPES